MASQTQSLFAQKLRAGIDAQNMSLERVVAELDMRGYTVPVHALRNWLRGYFLPRSEAAGEVISALEELLETGQSVLVQALAFDLASGSSFVPGEGARSLRAAYPGVIDGVLDRKFKESDKETDWQAELIRESLEDSITISADSHNVSHRVITYARIPAVPNPSMNAPVVFDSADVPAANRLIYDIEGARLAGQKVYALEDGTVNVNSRLAIVETVDPGELHRIAFTIDYSRTGDVNQATERYFPWPLKRYACDITFEGEVPSRVEYVFAPSIGEGTLGAEEVTVLKTEGATARFEREDIPKGIGFIRWE